MLASAIIAAEAVDATFPPPKTLGKVATYGANIQRTMTLLASSTPNKRNTVKVLFYGQSITEQDWWKEVAGDLKQRFPHANLLIENRAIGGFSADRLVKTAETDLYPFYPDLVIFHVYGSHIEYENIIRRIRERTTAEIMIQTDHFAANDRLDEPTDASALTPDQWTPWMNRVFLPSIAKKYDAELVNVRSLWRQYLLDHKLKPQDLLRDGVHLKEHGCFLMAEIVKAHLQHRPELPDDRGHDWVREYEVGRDVKWRDGKLTLEFEGNRVDAVYDGVDSELTVQIDGRRPSQIPELYARSRSTSFAGTAWPCLLKSSSHAPLVAEEWTLTLANVTDDMSSFRYRVSGSKTGPDGEGVHDAPFTSRSGRVVIDPADWNFEYAREVFKRSVGDNFEVKWSVAPLGVDVLTGNSEASTGVERAETMAQGLAAGRHRLTLAGDHRRALRAIRVYRPSWRGADATEDSATQP